LERRHEHFAIQNGCKALSIDFAGPWRGFPPFSRAIEECGATSGRPQVSRDNSRFHRYETRNILLRKSEFLVTPASGVVTDAQIQRHFSLISALQDSNCSP
jgi:hypothetical protein